MTTLPRVPLLHAGDRLTRAEFERRYTAMPDLKKAELLEGVVYIGGAVRYDHGRAHAVLAGWLAEYAVQTPSVQALLDPSMRLDEDNEPQPDVVLRAKLGTSRIDADDFLCGPPEIVVEVAARSVSYDLHKKLHVYRRAGVREYLVLRSEDAAVDWFALRDGVYERLAADAAGVVRSEVFPGLWLDVAALLAHDSAGLQAALAAGLRSPEHAAFVARRG